MTARPEGGPPEPVADDVLRAIVEQHAEPTLHVDLWGGKTHADGKGNLYRYVGLLIPADLARDLLACRKALRGLLATHNLVTVEGPRCVEGEGVMWPDGKGGLIGRLDGADALRFPDNYRAPRSSLLRAPEIEAAYACLPLPAGGGPS